MHRLGFSETEVFKQYKKLKQYSKQNVVKLMTHLASADVLSSQLTEQQVAKFTAIHQQLEQGNLEASVLNSAGLIVQKQSRFDWVRVGLLLYGVSPFSHKMDIEKQFKPVMEFVSEVIAIRTVNPGDSVGYGETWQAKNTTRIATVAAGYGDGYPRNAKSGTPVLVNGRKAHLAGRVSMDMLTADITDIPDVNIGDPVELWGQNLSVNHIASCVQTIGYELLTRMPTRASVQVLEDD
jgi:alanine racemase